MALKQAGIRLTLEGEASYRAGLKGISTEMRALRNEGKLAVAQLGASAKTSDVYKVKIESLGKQVQLAKDKSQALNEVQKRLKDSMGQLPDQVNKANNAWRESQKEVEALEKKLRSIKKKTNGKEHKKTTAALDEVKKATKELKDESDALNKELGETEKSMASLPDDINRAKLAEIELENQHKRLISEFRNSGGDLADISNKFKTLGKTLQEKGAKNISAGAALTNTFTRPIVSGFKQAIISAGEFESEIGRLGPLMSGGKEITAEVRAEMELLGKASREWAVDYGKHTSEINAGMTELIRNGYSTNQVMGMIPNILDASLASGEGFNSVLSTSAQVLSQFGLNL